MPPPFVAALAADLIEIVRYVAAHHAGGAANLDRHGKCTADDQTFQGAFGDRQLLGNPRQREQFAISEKGRLIGRGRSEGQ